MNLHGRVIVKALVVLLFAPGCGNDSARKNQVEATSIPPSATQITEVTPSPPQQPETDTPILPTGKPEPTPTPQPLEVVAELEGSIGPVNSLSWSRDGRTLASGEHSQINL